MQGKLDFEYGGLNFFVTVGIVDDNPAYVEEVQSVEIQTPSGEYMPVEFDYDKFMEVYRDMLDEKAQEYLRDLAIAYAEMRAEERREEELCGR